MNKKKLFRVSFGYLDSVYVLYAKKVTESELFGFVLLEDILFGETTSLVVDPGEERLKLEFNGVKRTYIPMQSILRVDEVEKQGIAKVLDKASDSAKVTLFPTPNKSK